MALGEGYREMVTSSYEPVNRPVQRRILISIAFFTAILLYGIISEVLTPSGVNILFLITFLVIWVVVLHTALFRTVHRLELRPNVLCWHGILRSGQIPLADLIRIRSARSGRSDLLIIEASNRRLRVGARHGMEEFVADIQQAAPQVEVTVTMISSSGPRY
jgi:hypothetical protein